MFLTETEKNSIIDMFAELGGMGYFEQLERLDYYINFFNDEMNKESSKLTKTSILYKKMGVLVGLLVCIVLI